MAVEFPGIVPPDRHAYCHPGHGPSLFETGSPAATFNWRPAPLRLVPAGADHFENSDRPPVLPDSPVTHIFRWDLDKTYLRTEFDTLRDLVETALETPEQKDNVPGAIELILELQRSRGEGRSLITFISGSPTQMRETLEQKFALDGVEPDIFVLKPTLRYALTGEFESIRGQLGFKLETLLELRARSPLAPETLFGDDAEQDAFIYSLYADLVAGRVDADNLRAILGEARVHARARATIMEDVGELDVEETVDRIVIHLEERSPPADFDVFGPRVVPVANYFQAALVLLEDGVFGPESVRRVAAGMVDRSDYDLLDFENSLEDLVRRGRFTPDAAGALLDIDNRTNDALPSRFARTLVERADQLAPASTKRRSSRQPNYLNILRSARLTDPST